MLLVFSHAQRHLETTDPRVVGNRSGVRAYELPGARASKSLHRVLDPATPISAISDPFGEGDVAAGAAASAAIKASVDGATLRVAPHVAAPLSMRKQLLQQRRGHPGNAGEARPVSGRGSRGFEGSVFGLTGHALMPLAHYH